MTSAVPRPAAAVLPLVADGTGSGPWSRVDAVHAAVLALGATAYVAFLRHIAELSPTPPMADAAGHTLHAFEAWTLFSKGPLVAFETLIYMGGGYPTLVYCLAATLFGRTPSPAALPNAMHIILVGCLLVGWGLARSRWGRASAWTWTLFVGLSPYVVGFASHFFLDLPLTAASGASMVALLRARRLDTAGPGFIFGLLAGFGMLMKWAFLFFLAPPFAVCALIALGVRIRARQLPILAVGALVVTVVVVAGGFYVGWRVGPNPQGADDHSFYIKVFAACVVVGGALSAWAARAKAAEGIRGIYTAIGAGVMVAAPWYVLGLREMYGLFALHSDIHATRTQGLMFYVAENYDSFRAFFPFIEYITGGALLVLLLRRQWAAFGDGLVGTLGVVSGLVCISGTVAPDTRYILPCLPLAAAIVAAAVSTLPTPLRWACVGLLAVGGIAAVRPVNGDESAPSPFRQFETNPDVTWTVPLLGRPVEVLRDPRYLDFSGFYAALDLVRTTCGSNCDVLVRSREDHWIQGRTFEAAAALENFKGVRFAQALTVDGDPGPTVHKALRNSPWLMIVQPCSFHPGDGSSLTAARSTVTAILGGTIESLGVFPLPGRCSMTVDRIVPAPLASAQAVPAAAPASAAPATSPAPPKAAPAPGPR